MFNEIKRVFIGPLPSSSKSLGGATMKNKTFLEYLNKNQIPVYSVNTDNWRNKALYIFVSLFYCVVIRRSKCIMLSTASDSALSFLKYFGPLLKKDQNLYYIVIGGTIGEKAQKRKYVVSLLRKCSRIFVETSMIKQQLDSVGINNVFVTPNFKSFNFKPKTNNYVPPKTEIKCYFLARVCKEKGTELAIEAIEQVNCQLKNNILTLDIYGPIEKGYETRFKKIILDSEEIEYKGIIDLSNEKNYAILSRYDLMLFPTFWHGEGFPGTIIDSFIAGVPIYASDWSYNSEIIEDGSTGRIFKANDVDSIVQTLVNDIKQPNIWLDMRKNCVEEAQKYHVDNVIPKMLEHINNNNEFVTGQR